MRLDASAAGDAAGERAASPRAAAAATSGTAQLGGLHLAAGGSAGAEAPSSAATPLADLAAAAASHEQEALLPAAEGAECGTPAAMPGAPAEEEAEERGGGASQHGLVRVVSDTPLPPEHSFTVADLAFTLRAAESSTETLRRCCNAVAALTAEDPSYADGSDAVEAVVYVLRARCDAAAVQSAACFALIELGMARDANWERAVAAGAVPVLLRALRVHGAVDAAFAYNTCHALRALAAACPSVTQPLVDTSVAVAAVGALRAHAADAQVCASVASLLSSSIVQECGSGAADCIKLFDAGVGEASIAAIQRHPNDAMVLLPAMKCVVYLFHAGVAGKSPKTRRVRALAHASARVAVDALRAHAAHQMVSENAAALLGHTMSLQCVRAETPNIGAFTAFLAAMRAQPQTAGVQTTCCLALGVMCCDEFDPAVNQDAAAGAGALAAIMAALRAHLGDADVLSRGCYALNALVTVNERNQRAAHALAADAALVAAMRAHPTSHTLLQSACSALRAMSCEPNSLIPRGSHRGDCRCDAHHQLCSARCPRSGRVPGRMRRAAHAHDVRRRGAAARTARRRPRGIHSSGGGGAP